MRGVEEKTFEGEVWRKREGQKRGSPFPATILPASEEVGAHDGDEPWP